MKNLYFLLFAFCLSLFGCQPSLKTKTKYNDSSTARLVVDTLRIPLDSVSLSAYPSASFLYSAAQSTLMYAFNIKTWTIDVFDLGNECLSDHIELEKEGANGVPYIANIQVLSPDSIVCFIDNGFLILDGKGKVIAREAMTYTGPDCVGNFETGQLVQPFYNKQQQKIWGRIVTSKEPYPYPQGQKLFAEYDIVTKTWDFMPVTLPPYMEKYWQQMGQNRQLSMWIDDDRISYNFSCLSDVFTYTISSQKSCMAGGESRMLDNEVSLYTGDQQNEKARREHWISNPVFYPPIYDKYKNIYYRIQVSGLKDDFHGTPTPYDKKIALAVFNSDLEMISEFRLENYTYNFLFFGVDKEGLIVDGNNPKDPAIDYEYLKLYRLRVLN